MPYELPSELEYVKSTLSPFRGLNYAPHQPPQKYVC